QQEVGGADGPAPEERDGGSDQQRRRRDHHQRPNLFRAAHRSRHTHRIASPDLGGAARVMGPTSRPYASRARLYADHAATTPLADAVWEAMTPYLRERFGNPSEPHWAGREARAGLEQARADAAAALGTAPAHLVFTGGGSEADNLAVLGRLAAGGR